MGEGYRGVNVIPVIYLGFHVMERVYIGLHVYLGKVGLQCTLINWVYAEYANTHRFLLNCPRYTRLSRGWVLCNVVTNL
jgi:hypothetical protein